MHQLSPRPEPPRSPSPYHVTTRQRAGEIDGDRYSITHTAARQRQLERRRDRPGARQRPKPAGKGEPHACWHHGRARQQRQDGARHEAISSSFDEQSRPPGRHASFSLCSLPRSLPPRASSACRVSCLSLTHARPARWLLARRLARAGCFRLADPLLLRVPSEGLTELTHGIKRLKERSPVE
jgi:hypothetical protein